MSMAAIELIQPTHVWHVPLHPETELLDPSNLAHVSIHFPAAWTTSL